MKQIKTIIATKWAAFMTLLLGVLGFSACGGNEEYGPDLYGCPTAKYKFNGNVKDSEGNKLSNIIVKSDEIYAADTTGTDGQFKIETVNVAWNELKLICYDPNGVYKPDTVTLNLKFEGADKNNMWDCGSTQQEVNFTLNKTK